MMTGSSPSLSCNNSNFDRVFPIDGFPSPIRAGVGGLAGAIRVKIHQVDTKKIIKLSHVSSSFLVL